MRHAFKSLGLLLLLLTAQQGAVVHELSHVSRTSGAQLRVDLGTAADANCALCPAFAQAASPAFSHSFSIPLLDRAAVERSSAPQIYTIDASVPRPRSRGPPSLS